MTPTDKPEDNGNDDLTSGAYGREPVEPIVKWLFLSILVLLLMLIGMDRADKSDSNIFQVIAGLVSAFSGALLMRIQPRKTPSSSNGGTPAPTASIPAPVTPLARGTPAPAAPPSPPAAPAAPVASTTPKTTP